MARNLDPKCKQCRRIGEKLFLKGDRCFSPKCAMIKRNYPPGMHGVKRSTRQSEYGIQLQEKQKAMRTYQILEKQFHNYYQKAIRMSGGETGSNLLNLLETRLDNTIYRLGIVPSRSMARQLVSHGHVRINDKNTTTPSYQVSAGDNITLRENALKKAVIAEALKKLDKKRVPSWLAIEDTKNFSAKVLSRPQADDLPEGINTALIVEFYSR